MRRVLERLLNLLAFLLTVDRPVTAGEIRNTVAGYDQTSDEAFRRMFERDKDLLRGMGIPLERRPTDEWEVEWGYLVPQEEYELPDPGLSDEERAALLLASQVVRLGAQPSGPDAVLKLGGAHLSDAGEPLSADLGTDEHTLADIFLAAIERRFLTFEYRNRTRRLAPYALVHQRGHWYVVGGIDGEVRSFRVDRATNLEVGERPGSFERPPRFSARESLPSSPWEAGSDDLEARVRFDASLAWWARRQIPGAAALTERRDGSLEVSLKVANPEAFVGWILAFGADAEILQPQLLRDQLVARVAEAA